MSKKYQPMLTSEERTKDTPGLQTIGTASLDRLALELHNFTTGQATQQLHTLGKGSAMPPRDQRSFKAPIGSSAGYTSRKKTVQGILQAGTNRRQHTILIVDDEPSILVIRRLVFETRGYNVLTARSGPEALHILEKNPVDLVVLDYRMPGMDGEATAIEIRRLYADLPIILSTGSTSLPSGLIDLVCMSVHKGSSPRILIDAIERRLQTVQPKHQPEKYPSPPPIGDLTTLWRRLYSFTRS